MNEKYDWLKYIITFLSGGAFGSIITHVVKLYNNRIQNMLCCYVEDEVISKIPIPSGEKIYDNIYSKKLLLKNTTNFDQKSFKIIFEFAPKSKIIKKENWSKLGKDKYIGKINKNKNNECVYTVLNFNRKDKIEFNFEVANIDNPDKIHVTEANCLGFKIKLKDEIKSTKRRIPQIITNKKDMS